MAVAYKTKKENIQKKNFECDSECSNIKISADNEDFPELN